MISPSSLCDIKDRIHTNEESKLVTLINFQANFFARE